MDGSWKLSSKVAKSSHSTSIRIRGMTPIDCWHRNTAANLLREHSTLIQESNKWPVGGDKDRTAYKELGHHDNSGDHHSARSVRLKFQIRDLKFET